MTVSRKISRKKTAPAKRPKGWTQRRDAPRAQKAEATKAALIDVARKRFTAHGYHGVGIRDLTAEMGLTRGAFSHHFPSKKALFLAVFDAVEHELMSTVGKGIDPSLDPWARFRKALERYLVAVIRPDVQRITLIDGPAVLGWQEWRKREERYSLGSITAALQAAMAAGLIRARPVEPLAHLIFGSVMEAALLVAHSENPKKRSVTVGRALDDLLQALE